MCGKCYHHPDLQPRKQWQGNMDGKMCMQASQWEHLATIEVALLCVNGMAFRSIHRLVLVLAGVKKSQYATG